MKYHAWSAACCILASPLSSVGPGGSPDDGGISAQNLLTDLPNVAFMVSTNLLSMRKGAAVVRSDLRSRSADGGLPPGPVRDTQDVRLVSAGYVQSPRGRGASVRGVRSRPRALQAAADLGRRVPPCCPVRRPAPPAANGDPGGSAQRPGQATRRHAPRPGPPFHPFGRPAPAPRVRR